MHETHPGRQKDAPEQVGPLVVARQAGFFPLKSGIILFCAPATYHFHCVFVFKAAVMCVSPLQVLLGTISS